VFGAGGFMKRASVLLGFLAAIFTLAMGARNAASAGDPVGLVAHEWGTFTSVAGADGAAVDWLPLGGPTDLPCFVERYKNLRLLKFNLGGPRVLTYDAARTNLWGKVRMETPVVYFYAREPQSVDVRVSFRRGLMSEWYPHAAVRQQDVTPAALASPTLKSTIEWRDVKVVPGSKEDFRTEPGASHYYAARDTDATPVFVNGQQEKFLFYRGVGGFDVPVSAVVLENGGVRVRNLGSRALRGVILLENRGGRVKYRLHGSLDGEATLAAPQGIADPAVIRVELERLLTDAGLYPREARAMVATWRDSWFEEGTRVFYVLAPQDVDAVLPLSIDPAPDQVARVFVGRMEVITPAALASVRAAVAANDAAALQRHGRFLGPIADRIVAAGVSAGEAERIRSITNAAFASYTGRLASCQ
jgi:hypothetical protein